MFLRTIIYNNVINLSGSFLTQTFNTKSHSNVSKQPVSNTDMPHNIFSVMLMRLLTLPKNIALQLSK